MNTENQAEKIDRHEFLRKLGLGGASLMAVYCGVTMSSCKNEEAATTTTPKNLTFDINTVGSNGTLLKNKGGYFVDTANSIVVAHTSADTYVTVTLICTHEGQRQVKYGTTGFMCTAHGATFDNAGKNLSVAPSPLKTYVTSLSGTTVTVTL
jgi:cytochrome b6-f complex iron-sulfur subunit